MMDEEKRGKGDSLLEILSFPLYKTFSVLPKLVYSASSVTSS